MKGRGDESSDSIMAAKKEKRIFVPIILPSPDCGMPPSLSNDKRGSIVLHRANVQLLRSRPRRVLCSLLVGTESGSRANEAARRTVSCACACPLRHSDGNSTLASCKEAALKEMCSHPYTMHEQTLGRAAVTAFHKAVFLEIQDHALCHGDPSSWNVTRLLCTRLCDNPALDYRLCLP